MAFIPSPAGALDASSLRPEEHHLHEHGAFLRSLARALTRDPALADDLVQETLAAQWSESKGGDAPGKHWLSTVLRRKAANAWRSDTRRQAHEFQAARSEQVPSATVAVARADAAQRLFSVVNQLEAPVRDAIIARFYGGLTFEQIAKEQDAPASTIKSRVTRGLAALRTQLDQDYPGGREQWLGAMAVVTGAGNLAPEGGAVAQGLQVGSAMGSASGAAAVQGATWPALLFLGAAAAALVSIAVLSSSPGPGTGTAPPPASVASGPSPLAQANTPSPLRPLLAANAQPPASRSPVPSAEAQEHHGEVRTVGAGAGTKPEEGIEVRWRPKTPTTLGEIGYVGDTAAVAKLTDEGPTEAEKAASAGGTAKTNALGQFKFDVEPSGERIQIDVPGTKTHRGTRWTGTLAEWKKSKPLVITRVPHGAMTGRVTDLSGKPLKGATVRADASYAGDSVDTVSGPDGSFRFEHLGPTYQVHVKLDGYVLIGSERPKALDQGGWAPHEFVLTRAGTLRLTIPVGKEPLPAGRYVSAFASATEFTRNWRGPQQTMTEVKVEGAEPVTVSGLPIGRELAFFSSATDALYTHRVGNMAILAPRTDDDRLPPGALPIVIPEGGVLELTVPPPFVIRVEGSVQNEDDQPVANALILGEAPWADEAPALGYLFRTRSSADGRFGVNVAFARRPLPLKVYALDSSDTGPIDFAAATFDSNSSPSSPLQITLKPTDVDAVQEAIHLRPSRTKKPQGEGLEPVAVTGSVRRAGPMTDIPIYLCLVPSDGSPAVPAGLTAFGRPSRFVSVDTLGRFRLKAPLGDYTAWIGTRDELVDAKPRRRVGVSITAAGMSPKTL